MHAIASSTPLFRRLALTFTLVLSACSSVPAMPPRTQSAAFAAPDTTSLGQRVKTDPGATATRSGLRLLSTGEEAFATLIALADSAEKTIDMQYYAVLNDTSSRVLLQHVRQAADRGVRVRLLVDDLATTGADDALLRLTHHPRMEVRLYNPSTTGRGSVVMKVLTSLNDIPRINSRMHNKQFVADNALAVTGGRNIGDAYFLQNEAANFVDLDVLVGGAVVRSLSKTFDTYWNSPLAYPADAIIPASEAAARTSAKEAKAPVDGPAIPASGTLDEPAQLPGNQGSDVSDKVAAFKSSGALNLIWAPVRLLADSPDKTLAEGDPSADETMFDDLGALLQSAQRDVLIVSPYFVPGERGLAAITALRQRGIRVRILTASMAASDAPIVHVGYAKYRKPLLQQGVELYELRPDSNVGAGRQARGAGYSGLHSRTNLHAKAMVIDGRRVLIGSMNLDPRSARLNTEMGLLAASPQLAGQMSKLLEGVCTGGAYRVTLTTAGDLHWKSTPPGGKVAEFDAEPETSAFKRIGFRLLGPMAPESML